MDAATVGAVAAVAVPLVGFLYRVDKRAGKAVRLLTGEEEVEGDGVMPRLRQVEQRSAEHRLALRDHEEIEVPDLTEEEEALRADGGMADD